MSTRFKKIFSQFEPLEISFNASLPSHYPSIVPVQTKFPSPRVHANNIQTEMNHRRPDSGLWQRQSQKKAPPSSNKITMPLSRLTARSNSLQGNVRSSPRLHRTRLNTKTLRAPFSPRLLIRKAYSSAVSNLLTSRPRSRADLIRLLIVRFSYIYRRCSLIIYSRQWTRISVPAGRWKIGKNRNLTGGGGGRFHSRRGKFVGYLSEISNSPL